MSGRNVSGQPGASRPDVSAGELHPLALAMVGDALYTLHVRAWLLRQGPKKVRDVHKQSVALVRAEAQAKALRAIEGRLTADELTWARRGRNAKGSIPRGLSPGVYRAATAFEAVLGVLYWTGDEARARELMEWAVAATWGEEGSLGAD